jgi:hypothetical protein
VTQKQRWTKKVNNCVYFGENSGVSNDSSVVPRNNGRFWKEAVTPTSSEMLSLHGEISNNYELIIAQLII